MTPALALAAAVLALAGGLVHAVRNGRAPATAAGTALGLWLVLGAVLALVESLAVDVVALPTTFLLVSLGLAPILYTRWAGVLIGLVNLAPRVALGRPGILLVVVAANVLLMPGPGAYLTLLAIGVLVLGSTAARTLRLAVRLGMRQSGSGHILVTRDREVRLDADQEGSRVLSVVGSFGEVALSLGGGGGRVGIPLGSFTLTVGGDALSAAAALAGPTLRHLEELAPYGELDVNSTEITLRLYREARIPDDIAWRLDILADALTVPPEARAGRARALLGTDLLAPTPSTYAPATALALRLYALDGVLASGEGDAVADMLLAMPIPVTLESGSVRSGRVQLLLRAAAWRVDRGRSEAGLRLEHAALLLATSPLAWERAEVGRLIGPTAPTARLRALRRALMLAVEAHPANELSRPALQALARCDPASATPVLIANLDRLPLVDLGWVCELLARHATPGDPLVRAALHRVLTRPVSSASDLVSTADQSAAHALGVLGTLDDVAPLLAAGGPPVAIRAAVAAIQERLGGARGAVALADVQGGEVSVAARAGAVSVKG